MRRINTAAGGIGEGGDLPESPINYAPAGDAPAGALPLIVFSLAGEVYALEIVKVREIIRVPKITWVPGAAEPLRGVINLRGTITAVADLSRMLLGRAAQSEMDSSRIIVAESEGLLLGFLVDAVIEVAEINPAALQQPMRTLDGPQKEFIVAQTSMGRKMAGILDADRLIGKVRSAKQQAVGSGINSGGER